jgi:hypothetical protein
MKFVDPTGHEGIDAETGGDYDYFTSTNFMTGNMFLDYSVMPLFNATNNFSGKMFNYVSNTLGYANRAESWLVTHTGGNEGDVDALNTMLMFAGVPGSQFGRLSSGLTSGTINVGEGLGIGARGALAEDAAANLRLSQGLEQWPSKFANGQGFDGVFVSRVDGTINNIFVNESKYSASGNLVLNQTNTMGKQMSPEWIDANINKLMVSQDPSLRATGLLLDSNRALITPTANVMNSSGITRWILLGR